MKIKFTYYVLLLLSTCVLSQNHKDKYIDRLVKDVEYLADDKLKGRETGTKGEKKAAKYIMNQFKKYGLQPLFKHRNKQNNYYQKFSTNISLNPHSKNDKTKIKGVNVIGYCNNKQKETIVIGAHYDHLGYGKHGSRDTKNEIHNGADDNASGVSILINLIDQLCPNQQYNYLFIAFSGEEYGLLGSSYFVKNSPIDLETIRFMINFDMVGRLNNQNEIAINGVGTSKKWNKLIDSTNSLFHFNIKKSDSGTGPSDHTSFYLNNIPILHFFTGQHNDYHKSTDDIEKINFNGMYQIMSYVDKLIQSTSEIQNFDFQETQSNTKETPQFNVTLGIMPDYLFEGNGLTQAEKLIPLVVLL